MPDVSVKLKDIDEDNWMEVVMLTTQPDASGNAHCIVEEYVASNALSICQALYEDTWTVKAIYCGKKPVGFAMYGYSEERDEYELCRLMIDHAHQGKGLGSIALEMVLEEMVDTYDCDNIYLLVHKDNDRAKHIYEKLGFEPTGDMVGVEEIYCINLNEEE